MTYHIFENDNGWIMLHRSDCSFVNQGRGTQPERRGEQTRWHGPYPAYKDAEDAAKTMKGSLHPCKQCTPAK